MRCCGVRRRTWEWECESHFQGFLRGYSLSNLHLQCSVEVIPNRCIYNMQSTQMQERGGCVTRSGQITVTEYGMNIYNQGGMLRGK